MDICRLLDYVCGFKIDYLGIVRKEIFVTEIFVQSKMSGTVHEEKINEFIHIRYLFIYTDMYTQA